MKFDAANDKCAYCMHGLNMQLFTLQILFLYLPPVLPHGSVIIANESWFFSVKSSGEINKRRLFAHVKWPGRTYSRWLVSLEVLGLIGEASDKCILSCQDVVLGPVQPPISAAQWLCCSLSPSLSLSHFDLLFLRSDHTMISHCCSWSCRI